MSVANNVPLPLGDPIARQKRPEFKGGQSDPQEGLLGEVWTNYFSGQAALIETFPARAFNVSVVQGASTTLPVDMTNGTLTAGVYRLTYALRVSVQELGATVQLNLDWQDRGVVRTFTGASVAGGIATNYDSDTVLIYSDALAPVRFDVAVASLGTLRYDLDIILEEVKA